ADGRGVVRCEAKSCGPCDQPRAAAGRRRVRLQDATARAAGGRCRRNPERKSCGVLDTRGGRALWSRRLADRGRVVIWSPAEEIDLEEGWDRRGAACHIVRHPVSRT